MKTYIGTKQITAEPMNRGDYNECRGWQVPPDENPADDGYMITYPDGYVSWSPTDQFEEYYRSDGNFTFGDAKFLMDKGYCVARAGWNGDNMFIFKVNGSNFKVNREPLANIFEMGADINYHSHIDMSTADGTIVPWVCSQTDLEASDWKIVVSA